ncbi:MULTISPECIES: MgtC/SapB family protein [Chryseobacterium]|uniref:MgtC/SapB family protein n=1 Tax=Chryseobacterium TaxID=59732 RepID=UPI00155507C8|nr:MULTISPECIES: MgtC/SapB family protein [unclassified Chryseobacterium]MDC8104019.1 MgtC/SapB family protein [Chryseobacterium sp. B21-037]MDQ1803628.1 MgtC/SapB family protein [Chryseobacterium sp. CKR4-1]
MLNYNLANQEIAIRLLVAAVFGGLVGWDRQRKEGVAGLRTHMLVCVGSSLIMIVSAFGFNDIMGKPSIVLDPSRIAAQVISGIGFLGAGTILFLRPQIIIGLTTAAGLWAVAGIGLAVGGGLYFPAFIATVIILVILALLKPFERKLFKSTKGKTMTLFYNSGLISLAQIESIFTKYELVTSEIFIHSSKDSSSDELKVTFDYNSPPSQILSALDEFKTIEGITEINSHI